MSQISTKPLDVKQEDGVQEMFMVRRTVCEMLVDRYVSSTILISPAHVSSNGLHGKHVWMHLNHVTFRSGATFYRRTHVPMII